MIKSWVIRAVACLQTRSSAGEINKRKEAIQLTDRALAVNHIWVLIDKSVQAAQGTCGPRMGLGYAAQWIVTTTAAAVVIFSAAELWAQASIGPDLPRVEDAIIDPIDRLKALTPRQSLALRKVVTKVLWSGSKVVTGKVTASAFSHDAMKIIGRRAHAVTWLDCSGDGKNLSRTIYVQTSADAHSCLFIYHAGHQQGFVETDDPYTRKPSFLPRGVRALLFTLAAENCDLLLFSMPFAGENRNPASPHQPAHDDLAHVKPASGSALRYFTDPVIAAIDYATGTRKYKRIAMAGLSGGGWTTALIAAIEPRIGRTYSVAGTFPIYVRHGGDMGDWEQTGATELWSLVDYLDLYLMAVAEPSRRATHFWLSNDTCCFKAGLALSFAQPMTRHAREYGFGSLRFFADPVTVGHDVTEVMRVLILADLRAP